MRLGYEQVKAQGAEVVAITHAPPERGPQYRRMFKFLHPYLCDPERNTLQRYALRARKATLREKVRDYTDSGMLRNVVTPRGLTDDPTEHLATEEHVMHGVFVVNGQGIVRYARTGQGVSILPGTTELMQLLAGLSSA